MTDAPTNATEFTVSEISAALKRTVEDTFGHVRVRGEVSRISRPASGHIYFDLKDEKAVIAAVAWKGTMARWSFKPEQGLEVIASGRLTTYPGQSKYQLIVEQIEPAGAGALMALLEERRKKLLAEGLFDASRKRQLPFLPRVIGVVTSPSGAVIRDILHRLEDRFPTHVLVWPVRVQGENCGLEVAAGVRGFNALPKEGEMPRPDLIIVARGGGSIEDLWGFNEEELVRAAAASAIPVISAVGHQTDTTLVDYAADIRAPTPTGAAEMAVPVRAELVSAIEDLSARQRHATRRTVLSNRDRVRAASAGLPRTADLFAIARQRLDLAVTRLGAALGAARQAKALNLARIAPLLTPARLLRRTGETGIRLDELSRRAAPALTRLVGERRQRLAGLGKLLGSLGYRNVLKRGFALVTGANGKIVRDAAAVRPAERLDIELAQGHIAAIVQGETTPPSSKPISKPRPRRRSVPDDDQSSLF